MKKFYLATIILLLSQNSFAQKNIYQKEFDQYKGQQNNKFKEANEMFNDSSYNLLDHMSGGSPEMRAIFKLTHDNYQNKHKKSMDRQYKLNVQERYASINASKKQVNDNEELMDNIKGSISQQQQQWK